MPKPVLILCLGNEIISDDGFGPKLAQQLLSGANLPKTVEVISAPVAGLALLDLLTDRRRVLIVDTIQTGKAAAGVLHRFPAREFVPSRHLTTSHQISLPSALELGRQLGMNMPPRVDVLAVEAEDLETLQEKLTPAVETALPEALRLVHQWISECVAEEG